MSSKRKKGSLSQSSESGSEQSEGESAKRQRKSSGSSNGSARAKSRSGSSGSDSGTQRSKSGSGSRSGSKSGRSRSRSSSKHSKSPDGGRKSGSDSGTGPSEGGGNKSSDGSRKSNASGKASQGKPASDASNRSSGSEKGKRLLKASERKPSSKLQQSTLSAESDSEEEEKQEQSPKKFKKIPKKVVDKQNKSSDDNLKTLTWRDEFDDGLDSDLIGDDDDRDKLEDMTEKQREEELFKRAERREELKKRYEISKKLGLQQKNKPAPSESDKSLSSRSGSDKASGSEKASGSDKGSEDKGSDKGSGSDEEFSAFPSDRRKGYEEKHAKKFSALTDLKAKRDERDRREQARIDKEEAKRPKDKNLSDSDSGSDLEKIGKSSKKKSKLKASEIYSSSSSGGEATRRKSSSSSSSSSSSVSSISSGESDTERHKSKKVVKKAKNIETREELEKIRLSRYKIDKFCHLPIFKKTVVGCFVRIGIGHNKEKNVPVYRIAEIIDVCETAKVYGVMKARTNMGLRIRHGKQERVFRAEFVSNQHITESEFQKWRQTCELEHVELPTNQAIADKVAAIQKALTYRYSSHDVDKILASKEKFSKHPHNYAMHKAKLQKDRQQAVDQQDQEKIEEFDVRLAELEQRAEELDKMRTSTISTISLINDRNRKNNIIRAEKGINQEIKRIKDEGIVDDPFTRRKTKPVIHQIKPKEAEIPDEMTSELLLKLEQDKLKDDEAKKEENMKKQEADFKPKGPERKRQNPVATQDMFNAHDFDIDINVNEMADKEMPNSIALKPVTSSMAANNGPSKRSSKIEEWKKKRGII